MISQSSRTGADNNRALCGSSRSLLIVGDNWNNGANAGVSYLNANNSVSNSNSNIGSRLNNVSTSYSAPHLSVKYKNKESGLVAIKAKARNINVGGALQ